MKICIAGSRKYPRLDFVRHLVLKGQHNISVLVNGSTVHDKLDDDGLPKTSPSGVDRVALRAAWECGLEVELHRPLWEDYPSARRKAAPIARNTRMVHASEGVIVLWDKVSRGSRNILGTAKEYHKLLAVYGPDLELLHRDDRLWAQLQGSAV